MTGVPLNAAACIDSHFGNYLSRRHVMPKFPLNLSTGMQFVAAQTEKCITSNFVHQAEQQSSSHDILQGHLFGMLYLGSGFL